MEPTEKPTRLSDDEIAIAKERDDRATDAQHIAVLKSILVVDAFDLVDEFRRDAEREGVTVAELCESISVPVKSDPEVIEPETEQESDEQ